VTQLMIEDAPAPPFNAGTPDTAPPEMVKRVRRMLDQAVAHELACVTRPTLGVPAHAEPNCLGRREQRDNSIRFMR
jgi:hypothetical protein